MSDFIDKTIEAAVTWWVAAVGGGRRGTSGAADIDMLGAIASRDASPGGGDLRRFGDHLRAALRALLERRGERGVVHLSAEYGPEDILRDAAAGLRLGAFPMKTRMFVEPGDVTVRRGYRAPLERLLGDPVWLVELRRERLHHEDFDRWLIVYRGTDEGEARRFCAMARVHRVHDDDKVTLFRDDDAVEGPS